MGRFCILYVADLGLSILFTIFTQCAVWQRPRHASQTPTGVTVFSPCLIAFYCILYSFCPTRYLNDFVHLNSLYRCPSTPVTQCRNRPHHLC